MGGQFRKGGSGGLITSDRMTMSAHNGTNGIETPYGFVGSSGGGGCAVYENVSALFGQGGYGAGNGRQFCSNRINDSVKDNLKKTINADNYGGGGGGNTFCFGSTDDINIKSKGKGGCIIIVYEPYDENFPDLTVRYWQNNSKENAKERENTENKKMQEKLNAAIDQNNALRAKLEELKNGDL